MTTALIFDCFGVLYLGSRHYLYERVSKDNLQALADLNQASDYGYISEADYLSQVSELTGFSVQELQDSFTSAHKRNDQLIELIKSYKDRYKIGLLSNVGRGVMDEMISPSERRQLFDAVVLSSEVGLVKPNPEIYQLMTEKLGVEPSSCLMIDDMPANVSGAEMVGMQGVVYKTTSDLQIALDNLN